jgi:hypothetical protein
MVSFLKLFIQPTNRFRQANLLWGLQAREWVILNGKVALEAVFTG